MLTCWRPHRHESAYHLQWVDRGRGQLENFRLGNFCVAMMNRASGIEVEIEVGLEV